MNNPYLTPEIQTRIQEIALKSANATTQSVADAIQELFLDGVIHGMKVSSGIIDKAFSKEANNVHEQTN